MVIHLELEAGEAVRHIAYAGARQPWMLRVDLPAVVEAEDHECRLHLFAARR